MCCHTEIPNQRVIYEALKQNKDGLRLESKGSMILIENEESKLVAIGKTVGLTENDGSSGSTHEDTQNSNVNAYY